MSHNVFNDIDLRHSLPIHIWMGKQLNASTFEGLEWLDIKKKIFKLVWPGIHQPDEYKLRDIYEAWEENMKRNCSKDRKKDFSTMKKRLYDALRACNYIDPVRDLNVHDKQTGNYKAFRYLNDDEVEAKKNRRKKSSNDSSGNDPPPLESEDSCMSIVGDWKASVAVGHFPDLHSQNNQVDAMGPASMNVEYPFNHTAAPPELSSLDPYAADAAMDTQMNGASANPPLPVFNSLEEVLKELGLTDEELQHLGEYEVSLRYANDEVYKQVINFSNGFVVCPQGSEGTNFANIDCQRLYLPLLPGVSHLIYDVLNSAQGGFALLANPPSDLIGRRCCAPHIYYISNLNNEEPVKMVTGEDLKLFSYWDYMIDMCTYIDEKEEHAEQRPSRPKCEVMLVLGTYPKSAMCTTLISMFIKPVLAQRLSECFGFSDNSLSLYFSDDAARIDLLQNFRDIRSNQPTPNFG